MTCWASDHGDAIFAAGQLTSLDAATSNRKRAGPEVLDEATAYLWQCYQATAPEFTPEQCHDDGIPLLSLATDIWTQVSFRFPPTLEFA